MTFAVRLMVAYILLKAAFDYIKEEAEFEGYKLGYQKAVEEHTLAHLRTEPLPDATRKHRNFTHDA